jgi:hypothetical protein
MALYFKAYDFNNAFFILTMPLMSNMNKPQGFMPNGMCQPTARYLQCTPVAL